jgi:TrmH family RNA methyltransferase
MIKPYDKDCSYSYTFGFYPTFELLKHHKEQLVCIYVGEKTERSASLIKLASLVTPDKIIYSEKVFAKLQEKGNDHVIGVFSKYEETLDSESNHIVLVNPSDQGNLGNIMRSMAAFGYYDLAIILPAADRFNPKTVRASMGSFFAVRQKAFASFGDYLKEYPRSYYPFMLQSSRGLKEIEKPKSKYALVFGNEATGLPDSFENGNAVRIEQSEDVDSLNVATAAVVGMYVFGHMK